MEQLRHDEFDKSLTKEEKNRMKEEQIRLYELIIIDTECYFIYTKLLLDKLRL